MVKANSLIQEGESLDWTNSTGANVGYRDVVPLGERIFIAGQDIPNGATGTIQSVDVWELPADNTVAFNLGDVLYWDDAAGQLTKTVGTYRAGYAAAPKAQADSVAWVKIDY